MPRRKAATWQTTAPDERYFTSGSHFRVAAHLLRRAYSAEKIVGLFLARMVGGRTLESFLSLFHSAETAAARPTGNSAAKIRSEEVGLNVVSPVPLTILACLFESRP
jgi:hypothetical protein